LNWMEGGDIHQDKWRIRRNQPCRQGVEHLGQRKCPRLRLSIEKLKCWSSHTLNPAVLARGTCIPTVRLTNSSPRP
jgi:hypothetical protein